MRWAPIGEFVSSVTKWDPRKCAEATPFKYVDLSSIDRAEKIILRDQVALIDPAEAPSRARQLLDEHDVLVSTVRPNLNGVALVTPEYAGATASTGYCVLRAIENQLDPRYLFHWVRTDKFIREMVRLSTGANYPAISDSIIKKSQIPVPPLNEQRRIASILDKADAILRKRQRAIELTDQLLRSVFLSMFGDPVTNPVGFTTASIGEISTKVTDGEHQNPKFVNDGIPMIMAKQVAHHGVEFHEVKFVALVDYEKFARKCNPERDDLLIVSRGATIGRTTLVDTDREFALMGSVILIKVDPLRVHPVWLKSLLTHPGYHQKLYKTSSASAQQAIYLSHLKELELPLPPLDEQLRFVDFNRRLNSGLVKSKLSLKACNDLARSLAQQVFSSTLTQAGAA